MIKPLLLVLALSLFAWMPLLSPGYFFNAHDAHHSVFWLVEFDQAIRDGAWWPRWVPDHAMGYGYPLWTFYSPLSYYIAEFFHLLGAGFTAAVKVTYILAFVVSGLAMYTLAKRWWGRGAGLVAGLVYIYAPYHLVDIYVRSAFAEFVAFVWFPWVLLAFWELAERGGARRLALAGLAYGLLVLTHSVTGIIFSPFLGFYILFLLIRRSPLTPGPSPLTRVSISIRERLQEYLHPSPPSRTASIPQGDGVPAPTGLAPLPLAGEGSRPRPSPWRGEGWVRGDLTLTTVIPPLLAIALGLGISTIFWLPLLLERNNIVQEQWVHGHYLYTLQFVYPHQFLSPLWGFGFAVEGPNDGMSLQLGALPVILSLFAVARALRGDVARRGLVAFLAVSTLAIFFLMTPAANLLWQLVPIGNLVQFPWRMLALTTLTTAALAGAAVADDKEGSRLSPAACALALVVVLASFPYTQPQLTPITSRDESVLAIFDFERAYPDMVGSTAWAQPPHDSPLLAQYEAGEPLRKAVILSGAGTVEPLRHGGQSDEVLVRAATEVRLQFLTYWYPGWRATIDGQPVPITREGPYGLITLDVPAGEHRVAIRFGDTPARTLAAAVSGLSVVVFAGLWVSARGIRRERGVNSLSPEGRG
ncbi:MAG: glycosyltransferase family 39 protein [Anaerolineae bacterium]|nr:glycosyltransferase family 39 protein [Anaerolineae bacterium]